MTPPSAARRPLRARRRLLIATCLKDLSQSSNPSAPVPHSAARAGAAPKTAAITAAKTKAFKSLPRIGSSGFITNRWGRARLGRRGCGIVSALVAWTAPNSHQKDAGGETASSACLMKSQEAVRNRKTRREPPPTPRARPRWDSAASRRNGSRSPPRGRPCGSVSGRNRAFGSSAFLSAASARVLAASLSRSAARLGGKPLPCGSSDWS